MLILFLNNNDNNNGNEHFESAKSLKVLSALKKKHDGSQGSGMTELYKNRRYIYTLSTSLLMSTCMCM